VLRIRPALPSDAAPLTELYNHYVRETAITFDIEPWTVAQRERWMSDFAETGRYRLRIAEEDGRVAGYACTRRFRDKAAYETTVEVSAYLLPDVPRRGIGTALYTALFDSIRAEDVHRAIAGITLPNAASTALHQRFGFTLVGVMTDVGRKFERYWDVAWYEKALG
jgi:phosphinothricin acetyltransferase